MIGLKFNKWTVISEAPKKNNHRAKFYSCKCECGNASVIRADQLKSGHSKGCKDCFEKRFKKLVTKHNLYNSRTYSIWRGIKKRCLLKSHPSYLWYGGKGISFDSRWKTFDNFLEDMGEVPEGHEIDRIDTTGHYTKENCRWVLSKENQNNRINNIMRDEFALSGKKYNKWTIIREVLGNKMNGRHFECKCECGTIKVVLAAHLKSGKSSQCRDCGNQQMYMKRIKCLKTGRILPA